MENFTIIGGRRLSGKVEIEGAKNSILPILAASILAKGKVEILSCPKIKDVLNMIKILEYLGVETKFEENTLIIDNSSIQVKQIPKKLAEELRASICFVGALLSLSNQAKIAYPGGCSIGKRPVDIHLDALRKLGVECKEYKNGIWCNAKKGIIGNRIILPFPSVGATENIMLASVFCRGKTIIHNCAKEPEIIDLANFINSMGGKVLGAGTARIEIIGVDNLSATTYKPMADRIEFGTYLISAVITSGEVEIYNFKLKNIDNMLYKFLNNTCSISINNDIIYIKSNKVKNPFSFETGPYPNFPTDMQAQTMALLSVCEGKSTIKETLFENRFSHVNELVKMGADISVNGNVATINGVKCLHGEVVGANDLRGGASLVLAGLVAEGRTIVNNVHHIERGYLNMCEKLQGLGADIIKNY